MSIEEVLCASRGAPHYWTRAGSPDGKLWCEHCGTRYADLFAAVDERAREKRALRALDTHDWEWEAVPACLDDEDHLCNFTNAIVKYNPATRSPVTWTCDICGAPQPP